VRFGFALALASALSVVQLFVIPRRLDLVEYGQYRFFLVYASYLGVLHFGLVDGAFVRWAGRRPAAIAREWRTIGRWLIAIQAAIVVLALVGVAFTAQPVTRLYLLAFAVCAVCVNAAALSAYALQAAGDFRGAGRVVAVAPALFVAAVLVIPVTSLSPLLAIYLATYAMSALYGAFRVARMQAGVYLEPTSDQPQLSALLGTGLSVLGANLAAILSQSADRILLTLFAPITSFALYGFASTVTVAASTATLALSRVALAHAARQPATDRASFLGGFYNVIGAAFGVALFLEPLFEHLVRVHLPAYTGALPIVRALTLGTPFWVATHVVLVTTLQSYGLVRRQLTLELIGVTLVLSACGLAVAQHAPLWGVAAAASLSAATAFCVGLALVGRAVPSASAGDGIRYVLVTSVQGAALLVALTFIGSWIGQTLAVIAIAIIPTLWAASQARKRGW
jgi:O-antigen/teichoic acid export membrane protein